MVSISFNILIPVAVVILLLIVIVWILYSKNKLFAQKLTSKKVKRKFYRTHLENLKNLRQSPEKDFTQLNRIARGFFKEYHNLEYNLTYLELAQKFKELSKPNYEKFCQSMNNLKYAGRELTANQIKELIDIFTKASFEELKDIKTSN